MDIHELYLKAGELHGHYCPGLAIGVRAGAEALRILEVEKKGFNLYCIAENRACYQDGIQMVFGTTLGDGNLELRQRGKTAFNFYDRDDLGVRLTMAGAKVTTSVSRKTDYLIAGEFPGESKVAKHSAARRPHFSK